MSLVWHIVKKDLRRMAWPVVGWVVFVVVSTLWLRQLSPSLNLDFGEVGTWINLTWSLLALLKATQLFVGYLLAGSLVLDDSTESSSVFWRTRPIPPARLLTAKAIGGLLLFVTAPALVLIPVWWCSGFSVFETACAARNFACWQLWVLVFAWALASVCSRIEQFIFATVASGIGYVACVIYGAVGNEGRLRSVDDHLWFTRVILVQYLPFLIIGAVIWLQYFHRGERRGAWLIGLGLVALFAIQVAWPWRLEWTLAHNSLLSHARSSSRWPLPPSDWRVGLNISGVAHSAQPEGDLRAIAVVEGAALPGEIVVPLQLSASLQWNDGRSFGFGGYRGQKWADAAMRSVLAGAASAGAISWQMRIPTGGLPLKKWQIAPARIVTGVVYGAAMRAMLLGNVPLQTGAEFRRASHQAKVLSVISDQDRVRILVESRDARTDLRVGLKPALDVMRPGFVDGYLLVNRRTGEVICPEKRDPSPSEVLAMNSFGLMFAELEVQRPALVINDQKETLLDWASEITLVAIRFEADGYFSARFEQDRLALSEEGAVP